MTPHLPSSQNSIHRGYPCIIPPLASDDKFYSFLEENVLSLIKENDLVFVVSDGVFESLVQAGIEKEKIIKNYNGVDAHY